MIIVFAFIVDTEKFTFWHLANAYVSVCVCVLLCGYYMQGFMYRDDVVETIEKRMKLLTADGNHFSCEH